MEFVTVEFDGGVTFIVPIAKRSFNYLVYDCRKLREAQSITQPGETVM